MYRSGKEEAGGTRRRGDKGGSIVSSAWCHDKWNSGRVRPCVILQYNSRLNSPIVGSKVKPTQLNSVGAPSSSSGSALCIAKDKRSDLSAFECV